METNARKRNDLNGPRAALRQGGFTLAVIVALLSPSISVAAVDIIFRGNVSDQSGDPIIGATVQLFGDGLPLTGVACDLDGAFAISWTPDTENEAEIFVLEFSCVGFQPRRITLGNRVASDFSPGNLSLALVALTSKMDGVSIVADQETGAPNAISGDKLVHLSRQSFAPSNSLEAVRGPAVSRSGSAFGSQIRFAGSSPDYKINGASLGRDAAHYGMFALVPTEALDRMTFSAHAYSASSASPTTVELHTDRRFGARTRANITISALETVGAFRRGNESYFVGAALRKSVLDKLVQKFPEKSSTRQIPPTNFQDVFVNTGLRISPSVELFFDQYHTRDYLVISVGPTSINTAGVNALQHTSREQYNLELRGVSPKLFWKIAAQAEFTGSEYRAHSDGSDNPASLELNLTDTGRRFNFRAELTRSWKSSTTSATKLTVGAEETFRSYLNIHLNQSNWNFQPPQATSDNPNIYQLGLNILYPQLDISTQGNELAVYAETERSFSDWTFRAGARGQLYTDLAHNYDLLGRLSLSHRINRYANVDVSYGSYAESPLGNLIEPYQILVRQRINRLNSIKTHLISLNYERNYRNKSIFAVKLFAKRITDLPALTPTFSQFYVAGFDLSILTDLGMRSVRNQEYAGASLSYRRNQALYGLFGDRLDIAASYGLSLAREKTRGIQTLVGEHAPHQAELSADYRAGGPWAFGSRLTVRSGYRYTATRDIDISSAGIFQTYSGALDLETLAAENRERFDAHINLNLSMRFESGGFATFANIGNLLNRKNPIISAYDGFIYDSGILPSIGASWQF